MAEISAIPQQPQLGRLAQFLRYLETEKPEFLPRQLDVMGLVRQLTLPQASTVENLSYGNLPFTMPPSGTGAMIPQVKTGRKAEVADLVGMLGGVPGMGAVADVGTKLSNEAADAIVRAITRNPAATAPQVIQETAMPLMQAVAPRAPGLLETPAKSDLGFYSALEQATIPLQNKGTGAQFLAQIEKTAGVKPEEVKWTGLDEFLKSRQNVTKQEVQDYLAANRVNLQEVRLGGATSPYPYRTADEWQGAINRAEVAGNWDEAANLNQAWEAAEGYGPAGSTKFSSYTLPGGENYREILLTLPTSGSGGKRVRVYTQDGTSAVQVMSDADIQRMAESGRRRFEVLDEVSPKGTFQSSHFDQPNILAHMRVNDRVVDGKKTLFIEEIQSDWHQAGRKRGYGNASFEMAQKQHAEAKEALSQEILKLDPEANVDEAITSLRRHFNGSILLPQMTPEIESVFKPLVNQEMSRLEVLNREKLGGGVPDAPFKTTWHELTLKRAIQEASEKGYDQIAFTTGKTQAERYDLSKQVDNIEVGFSRNLSSGKQQRMVNVSLPDNQVLKFRVNDDGIIDWSNTAADYKGKALDDLIGKEMAQKVIATNEPKTFAGVDLQIGGEGMKGFYDQILPKTLDKLGKKFDAKVGKTEMDGVEVWAMDITPKMRESVLTKGQPLFAATPAIPAAGLLGDENE